MDKFFNWVGLRYKTFGVQYHAWVRDPVSVVVTPSFEVYNSYGDIHAWEVIGYFEEHMKHPNDSARSEFLRNKLSATVMR